MEWVLFQSSIHSFASFEKPHNMAPHSGFTTGVIVDWMAPSCVMPLKIESFLHLAENIGINVLQ